MIKNIKRFAIKNPALFKHLLAMIISLIFVACSYFEINYLRMENNNSSLGMFLFAGTLLVLGGIMLAFDAFTKALDEGIEEWKLDIPEFWDEKFMKCKEEFPSHESMFVNMQKRSIEEKKKWLIEWEKYRSNIKQKKVCNKTREECDKKIRTALAAMRAMSGMK